ncbi:MAG: hypothetical protein HY544_00610 [Candidatus Diapherotrites archaeon]|uniref:Uncharacterized protein n=1 Tax=Candidatus Iainarchaeum sp. TaxID=3101447 RepID=A0A8T3YHJ9_9ARCH|nr:hypothetical protein [Candidatus Diapherotrites archaeon]
MFSVKARKKGRRARMSVRAGQVLSAEEFYSRPYFASLPENFNSGGRANCEHIALGRLMKLPNLIRYEDGKTLWVGNLPPYVGSRGSAIIEWKPNEKRMVVVSLWVPKNMRLLGNCGKIINKVIQVARERGAKTITGSTSKGILTMNPETLLREKSVAQMSRNKK